MCAVQVMGADDIDVELGAAGRNWERPPPPPLDPNRDPLSTSIGPRIKPYIGFAYGAASASVLSFRMVQADPLSSRSQFFSSLSWTMQWGHHEQVSRGQTYL